MTAHTSGTLIACGRQRKWHIEGVWRPDRSLREGRPVLVQRPRGRRPAGGQINSAVCDKPCWFPAAEARQVTVGGSGAGAARGGLHLRRPRRVVGPRAGDSTADRPRGRRGDRRSRRAHAHRARHPRPGRGERASRPTRLIAAQEAHPAFKSAAARQLTGGL